MIRRRAMRGLLLFAALALAPAGASGGEPARVAVLATSSGVPEAAAAAVAAAAVEAVRDAGMEAVPPEDVSRAVVGANAAVGTCARSAACAKETCGAVEANALLATSVKAIASGWLIEMRLREGLRGSLLGGAVASVARNERAAREASARLTRQMIEKLESSGTIAKAAPFPARPAQKTATASGPAVTRPRDASGRSGVASSQAESQESATSAGNQDAAPEPRLAPDPRLASSERGSEKAPSSSRRLGAILASGGVALLAGGATAGVLAWSESRRSYGFLVTGSIDGYAIESAHSRTLVWTAAGLGGAGALALASGVWLRLGEGSPPVSLSVDPSISGARLAFAF